MLKIKFELSGQLCTTPCPNKMCTPQGIILVGSVDCSECDFYGQEYSTQYSKNPEPSIVLCSYDNTGC